MRATSRVRNVRGVPSGLLAAVGNISEKATNASVGIIELAGGFGAAFLPADGAALAVESTSFKLGKPGAAKRAAAPGSSTSRKEHDARAQRGGTCAENAISSHLGTRKSRVGLGNRLALDRSGGRSTGRRGVHHPARAPGSVSPSGA